MLVMFAVGLMNVFWMALMALLALASGNCRAGRLPRTAARYCLCGRARFY
jgi:predicted metal-binding membrane protein